MKVYVSYIQTGVDEDVLKSELKIIKDSLNYLNLSNFIWYFDKNWQNLDAKDILFLTKQELEKSDIILVFVNHNIRSEGMFEELGMSYILGKKMVFFINNILKDKFWSLNGYEGEKIYFKDLKDLENKILYYFGITLQREIIDNVDKQIIDFIYKRFEAVKRVGLAKKRLKISPLQPDRWKQVLEEKIELANKYNLDKDFIKDIWEKFHNYALNLEK